MTKAIRSKNDKKKSNTALTKPINAENYRSKKILKLEIREIFQKSWLCIGRADQIKSMGDYITIDIEGFNLIIIRDTKKKFHCFANTCMHRGARLLSGNGKCKGIRCPFHSWFYDLEGNLISVPRIESLKRLNKKHYRLKEYKIKEYMGFLFVSLSKNPITLKNYLGNFYDVHAYWPLKSLRTFSRRSQKVNCNWKSFLEVFNEYYHLPSVHPTSVNSIYNLPLKPNKVTGAFASQFGSTTGTGGLLQNQQENALPNMSGLDKLVLSGVRYTWLFPNMTFAANADALWMYESYPMGPSQCQIFQTICFPPETFLVKNFRLKAGKYLERMDLALKEDILALENQHSGINCKDASLNIFHPLLEANLMNFSKWYKKII